MIRVLEVSTESDYRNAISRLIDKALEELSNSCEFEVVDIKYQVIAYKAGYGIIHRTSALIIYKESAK